MDFFESQEHARKLSGRLLFLFGLAVVAMIVLVYITVVVALGFADIGALDTVSPGLGGLGSGFFHPEVFMAVALGMLLLIGGGTATRTAQLRKGGPAVAELLGGRRIDPGTRDLGERRLLNVVEEMAIASGLPVPAVFVLDGEEGVNAFAAGHTIHDAAVAVTRGGLDLWNRDELQGVMAHEFSHILNGDMRLNVRLMGMLFGILLLTVVGRGVIRGSYGSGRRRSGRGGGGGGQIMLIGLVLILLGYLGVFFGRLIQAAVSRQREFLADAAAVQFTRNPRGISRALQKIGGAQDGARLNNHHAQEAGHLFFADGVKGAFSRSLATHPPLKVRIKRIDPEWDGRFIEPRGVDEGAAEPRGRRAGAAGAGTAGATGGGAGSDSAADAAGAGNAGAGAGAPGAGNAGTAGRAGLTGASGLASAGASVGPGDTVGGPGESGSPGAGTPHADARGYAEARGFGHPVAAVGRAGELDTNHMAYARKLLEAIPPDLREATRTPEAAVAVVAGLLVSPQEDTAARQREIIDRTLGPETGAQVRGLHPGILQLGPAARLPLLELSLPALRDLPPARASALQAAVGPLTRADGRIHPFDFAVFHLLRKALPGGPEPGARRSGPAALPRLHREVETLLSALAWAGSDIPDEVERAFDLGVARLRGGVDQRGVTPALTLQSASALGLDRVDGALDRLEGCSPPDRKALLEALATTVQADGKVTIEEMEMLRAVAEALEVPMPAGPTD